MTIDPAYLPHYTVTDYQLWEGQWELIEGIPYAMAPAPTVRHQLVSGRLLRCLDEKLETCPQCLALMEVEWRIREDTIVIPDISVICYPPGDYLTRAPTLIAEVVSSNSHLRDERIKFELYAREGVL
ncbi:MAG TPA: Uma2 family endonuclease [Methylothermaceae bacterium]|nr:Uma2 family endonuclease [Methylothermaceae bacterium]